MHQPYYFQLERDSFSKIIVYGCTSKESGVPSVYVFPFKLSLWSMTSARNMASVRNIVSTQSLLFVRNMTSTKLPPPLQHAANFFLIWTDALLGCAPFHPYLVGLCGAWSGCFLIFAIIFYLIHGFWLYGVSQELRALTSTIGTTPSE